MTGVHMPTKRVRTLCNLPDPMLCFKVFPESRRGVYFEVQIYKTWQQLKKIHTLYFPEKDEHSVYAFTHALWLDGGGHLGTACFYLKSATDRTVAHECLHMAMWWAHENACGGIESGPRDQRIDLLGISEWNHPDHERFAEVLDQLVSDFWMEFTKWFKRKECWGWEDR